MDGGTSLYDRLGVDASADADTLRAAYRDQAKRHHPDRSDGTSDHRMALVNEAWAVLSDPQRRAAYDRTLAGVHAHLTATATVTVTDYEAPRPRFARREAWYAGLRVQIARLTREAVTSASWALSLKRHGRPRAVYLAQLDPVVHHLIQHTAERITTARAAGAAPLDLALAAALVGLRSLADEVLLDCRMSGPDPNQEILAEVIDKTWDHLAHGVSHEVEVALGGNPHVAKALLRG